MSSRVRGSQTSRKTWELKSCLKGECQKVRHSDREHSSQEIGAVCNTLGPVIIYAFLEDK